MMKHYNKNRINAALNLLEDAAKEKRKELSKHINGKYKNIKAIFTEEVGQEVRHASKQLTEAVRTGQEMLRERFQRGESLYKEAQATVKKKIEDVDEKVSSDPYKFMAGVALTSVAIGYLMGWRKNQGDL